MKIFVAHSSDLPFKLDVYKALRGSVLNSQHEIFLPQETGKQPPVPREFIRKYDFLLAEVSVASTGMGIELGWCDMMHIPVLCIYKKGHTPTGAIKNVSKTCLEYKDYDHMVKQVSEYISQL
nr:hypothetical protein [uncultured bacterium]